MQQAHTDGSVGGLEHGSLRPFSAFVTLPAALQKYICAATAASIAEAVTMPLDVMKTRMQLDLTPLQQGAAAARGAPVPQRRGLLATGLHIYQTEGFSRLYLGLTPAMLRQAIVGGIGVGLYPQIKDMFVHVQHHHSRGVPYLHALRTFSPSAADAANKAEAASSHSVGQPLSFGTKVLAGATSGVVGQICAAPTCVVKVRLQADARLPQPRYLGTLDAFMKIPQQEGWRALFSGIVPSLQRAACMYGATISTYDHVKHALVSRFYSGDARAMDFVSVHVASSSVSGLVASLVSTPFDTIKTRIISQAVIPRKSILGAHAPAMALATAPAMAGVGSAAPAVYYSSTLDCVVKTVRSEGVLAIYKGLLPCYMRLAPWQLCFFVCYEQLSILLTGHSLR